MQYRFNPVKMSYTMQIIWLPSGNVSYIIQIRNLSALKYLDHRVEYRWSIWCVNPFDLITVQSDVWTLLTWLRYSLMSEPCWLDYSTAATNVRCVTMSTYYLHSVWARDNRMSKWLAMLLRTWGWLTQSTNPRTFLSCIWKLNERTARISQSFNLEV